MQKQSRLVLVYRHEEISLAWASVSWPLVLPLTPRSSCRYSFSHFSPLEKNSRLYNVSSFSLLFRRGVFVLWPKVDERKRGSSRTTTHSLRQHLLLIPHRNGVLHYLGFCPSVGFIFRLNYLGFRGCGSQFAFLTMLWWTSWYGRVRQRDVYQGMNKKGGAHMLRIWS